MMADSDRAQIWSTFNLADQALHIGVSRIFALLRSIFSVLTTSHHLIDYHGSLARAFESFLDLANVCAQGYAFSECYTLARVVSGAVQ